MNWVLCLALCCGETIALKDKAAPTGKFVALLDIIDVDRLTPAGRGALKDVYLGRAPEEGRSRPIMAEEVRKELERRGFDLNAYRVEGEKVVVAWMKGTEPKVGESVRRLMAFEIKRHLLGTVRGLRADQFSVRIQYLNPETLPEDADVAAVVTKNASDTKASEFELTLEYLPKDKKNKEKLPVLVVARILKLAEVAFAVREINAQHTLTHEDFEMKRIEVDDPDRYIDAPSALIGGKALAKIAKGSVLTRDMVKTKPLVKRGEVVRAESEFGSTDARTLEEGSARDIIELEYVNNRIKFRGKIISAGVVEVVAKEEK